MSFVCTSVKARGSCELVSAGHQVPKPCKAMGPPEKPPGTSLISHSLARLAKQISEPHPKRRQVWSPKCLGKWLVNPTPHRLAGVLGIAGSARDASNTPSLLWEGFAAFISQEQALDGSSSRIFRCLREVSSQSGSLRFGFAAGDKGWHCGLSRNLFQEAGSSVLFTLVLAVCRAYPIEAEAFAHACPTRRGAALIGTVLLHLQWSRMTGSALV